MKGLMSLFKRSKDSTLSQEMINHFYERTTLHISLVQKYLQQIIDLNDSRLDNEILEKEKDHDQSKYEDPEYQPYLHVNWSYHLKDKGEQYDPPQEIKDQMQEATPHHVKNNPHHPEYWDSETTIDDINRADRDKPLEKMVNATTMPLSYVASMVADWMAMSEEKGTNPAEWAKANINKRWEFTVDQIELIYDLLDELWMYRGFYFSRSVKHLQGQHDQQSHGGTSRVGVKDVSINVINKENIAIDKNSLDRLKNKIVDFDRKFNVSLGKRLNAVDINIVQSTEGFLGTGFYAEADRNITIDVVKIRDDSLQINQGKWSIGQPDDVFSTFRHEYGHYMFDTVMTQGQQEKFNATVKVENGIGRDVLKEISGLASKNNWEAFSELFAAKTSPLYRKLKQKQKLPKQIDDYFDDLLDSVWQTKKRLGLSAIFKGGPGSGSWEGPGDPRFAREGKDWIENLCGEDKKLFAAVLGVVDKKGLESHYFEGLNGITQEGDSYGKPMGDNFKLINGSKTQGYYNPDTGIMHIRLNKSGGISEFTFLHELGHSIHKTQPDHVDWAKAAGVVKKKLLTSQKDQDNLGLRPTPEGTKPNAEIIADIFRIKYNPDRHFEGGKVVVDYSQYNKILTYWAEATKTAGVAGKYQNIENLFSKKSVKSIFKGGPGSGNFGHEGRPGEVGGSGEARSSTGHDAAGGNNHFVENQSFDPVGKDLKVLYHVTRSSKIKSLFEKGIELRSGERTGVGGALALEQSVWMYERDIKELLPHFEERSYKSAIIKALVPEADIVRTSISGVVYSRVAVPASNVEGAYKFPKSSATKIDKDHLFDLSLHKQIVSVVQLPQVSSPSKFKKKVQKGGPSSGNFGHSGRLGQVGGSGEGIGNLDFGSYHDIYHGTAEEFISLIKEKGLVPDDKVFATESFNVASFYARNAAYRTKSKKCAIVVLHKEDFPDRFYPDQHSRPELITDKTIPPSRIKRIEIYNISQFSKDKPRPYQIVTITKEEKKSVDIEVYHVHFINDSIDDKKSIYFKSKPKPINKVKFEKDFREATSKLEQEFQPILQEYFKDQKKAVLSDIQNKLFWPHEKARGRRSVVPLGIGKVLNIGTVKGGPGSGNFGHSGREGQVGGSGEDGGDVSEVARTLSSAEDQNIPRKEILEHIAKAPPEQVVSKKMSIEEWADEYMSDSDQSYSLIKVSPQVMNLPLSAGSKEKVEEYTQMDGKHAPPIVIDSNEKIQARFGGGKLDQAFGLQPHTVIDGKHRVEAGMLRGDNFLLAYVPKGKLEQIWTQSSDFEKREFWDSAKPGKPFDIRMVETVAKNRGHKWNWPVKSIGGLGMYFKGGPGSGNFGHEGRPGEVGGSGGDGGSDDIRVEGFSKHHEKIIREELDKLDKDWMIFSNVSIKTWATDKEETKEEAKREFGGRLPAFLVSFQNKEIVLSPDKINSDDHFRAMLVHENAHIIDVYLDEPSKEMKLKAGTKDKNGIIHVNPLRNNHGEWFAECLAYDSIKSLNLIENSEGQKEFYRVRDIAKDRLNRKLNKKAIAQLTSIERKPIAEIEIPGMQEWMEWLSKFFIPIIKTSLTSPVDRFDFSGWSFDKKRWDKRLREEGGLFIKEMYDKEGSRAYDGLRYQIADLAGAFNIDDPLVQEYLEDYVFTFANNINTTTEELLREAMKSGMSDGLGMTGIAEKIEGLYDTWGKWRSMLIARTETIRASNRAAAMAYRQSGVVSGKEWLVTRDDRLCPLCAPLNGKVIDLDKNFFDKGTEYTIGEADNAITMKLDYEDVESPPLHPNCRCALVPWFEGIDEMDKEYGLSILFKHLPGKHDQQSHGNEGTVIIPNNYDNQGKTGIVIAKNVGKIAQERIQRGLDQIRDKGLDITKDQIVYINQGGQGQGNDGSFMGGTVRRMHGTDEIVIGQPSINLALKMTQGDFTFKHEFGHFVDWYSGGRKNDLVEGKYVSGHKRFWSEQTFDQFGYKGNPKELAADMFERYVASGSAKGIIIGGLDKKQQEGLIEHFDASMKKLANGLRSQKSLGLSTIFKGGPGSGNFGHEGRPGEVGGSGEGDYFGSGILDLTDKQIEESMITNKAMDRDIYGKDPQSNKIAVQEQLVDKIKNHPSFGTGYSELVDERVNNYVLGSIKQWSASSGDASSASIEMQIAAKDYFGLKDANIDHMKKDKEVFEYANFNLDEKRHLPGSGEGQYSLRERHEAFLTVQYDATQKYFKEKGITEVILYRGVEHSDMGKLRNDMITMQPLSSFSTSVSSAMDFANIGLDYKWPGTLYSTVVPVHKILCHPGTGFGCTNEKEVVVLGGKMKATVIPTKVAEQISLEISIDISGSKSETMTTNDRFIAGVKWRIKRETND